MKGRMSTDYCQSRERGEPHSFNNGISSPIRILDTLLLQLMLFVVVVVVVVVCFFCFFFVFFGGGIGCWISILWDTLAPEQTY